MNRVCSSQMDVITYRTLLVMLTVKGVTDSFHSAALPSVYIDDNVLDKSRVSIFIGIQTLMMQLASPLGKQINGALTEVPTDLKDTLMTSKDQRFVGAWWLSYLIFGIGTASVSALIMLMPRSLVSSRRQWEALQRAKEDFKYKGRGEGGANAHGNAHTEGSVGDAIRKVSVVIQPEKEKVNTIQGKLDSHTHNATPRPHVSIPFKRTFSWEPDPLSVERKSSLAMAKQDTGTERQSDLSGPPSPVTKTEDSSTYKDTSFSSVSDSESVESGQFPGQNPSCWGMLKDLPQALYRTCRRPVFALLLLDLVITSIPTSGTGAFRSMYKAKEFNIPMVEVSLATAITEAVATVSGTFLSSILLTRVTSQLGYVWLMFASYLLATVISPLYLVFGCDNEPVYGSDFELRGAPENATDYGCGCLTAGQLISCGVDGRNYLSPCFAGCSGVDGKTFTGCHLLENSTFGDTVSPGLCPTSCHDNFIVYVLLHGVQTFVQNMSLMPKNMLILRLVDPQDRGFAKGLFLFSHVILGIPSPNLFGHVIDSTCLIWDGNYCSLYDRDSMRYLFAGIDMGTHILVQLTIILMIFVLKVQQKRAKRKFLVTENPKEHN
ncbi:solute carrier organic anion transporter family member 2B1 [Aplysia californica]|uniref:Solute carrier organic anion transporter family member 2B1 n=1 Tax=Aplysia californica TaxID=6500 RepID=A0ABM1A6R8_APLCA|nr:solute carrier organic anion transporter family member 2B1 [Aplysia californica]